MLECIIFAKIKRTVGSAICSQLLSFLPQQQHRQQHSWSQKRKPKESGGYYSYYDWVRIPLLSFSPAPPGSGIPKATRENESSLRRGSERELLVLQEFICMLPKHQPAPAKKPSATSVVFLAIYIYNYALVPACRCHCSKFQCPQIITAPHMYNTPVAPYRLLLQVLMMNGGGQKLRDEVHVRISIFNRFVSSFFSGIKTSFLSSA